MVLTSLTSETCPVTWRVWGFGEEAPPLGFLWVYEFTSHVNTPLIRLLALASSLEGSPSCWTTSCVHVYALQWGSGLWRILTKTRSVANIEQVVYILSILLKSRDFKEGLKNCIIFSTEHYNPLATFLFRLYLDTQMFGAFYKSKNRHQLNWGTIRLTCTCLSCPEKELN